MERSRSAPSQELVYVVQHTNQEGFTLTDVLVDRESAARQCAKLVLSPGTHEVHMYACSRTVWVRYARISSQGVLFIKGL